MFGTYSPNNANHVTHKETTVQPVKPSSRIINLAKQLPPSVSLGCAGWKFVGWTGLVRNSDEKVQFVRNSALSAYSQYPLFNSIGIDRSYFEHFNEMDLDELAQQVKSNQRFKFLLYSPFPSPWT